MSLIDDMRKAAKIIKNKPIEACGVTKPHVVPSEATGLTRCADCFGPVDLGDVHVRDSNSDVPKLCAWSVQQLPEGKAMKKKFEIETELRNVLTARNFAASDDDENIAYGAEQALSWVLSRELAPPSELVECEE